MSYRPNANLASCSITGTQTKTNYTQVIHKSHKFQETVNKESLLTAILTAFGLQSSSTTLGSSSTSCSSSDTTLPSVLTSSSVSLWLIAGKQLSTGHCRWFLRNVRSLRWKSSPILRSVDLHHGVSRNPMTRLSHPRECTAHSTRAVGSGAHVDVGRSPNLHSQLNPQVTVQGPKPYSPFSSARSLYPHIEPEESLVNTQ